jgi:excisionase family DNA binding protein
MAERSLPCGLTPRPFTVDEAADLLACSAANVRNLCRRGRLRHFRVGGLEKGPIRIPSDALGEFVRCASSGSGTDGTPMNEPQPELSAQAWGPRIVRLQNDGSET